MAVPQQKIREIVFQLLYSLDWPGVKEDALQTLLANEISVSKKVIAEAKARADLVRSRIDELDLIIAECSTSYNFNRIPSAERNILRLGIFELLFDDLIPPKVAIAEAIRLGRKFSTPESATFINAIMDQVFQNSKHT